MVKLMTLNKALPGDNPTIKKSFSKKNNNKSMFVVQYAPSGTFGH